MIVKPHALAAIGLLLLLFSGAVQAAIVDLGDLADPGSSGGAGVHVTALSPLPRHQPVTPPASMSELPEPEVFAMMLVGLVLIGYRASRDSSEKFE
jgi:hypothetical protein